MSLIRAELSLLLKTPPSENKLTNLIVECYIYSEVFIIIISEYLDLYFYIWTHCKFVHLLFYLYYSFVISLLFILL